METAASNRTRSTSHSRPVPPVGVTRTNPASSVPINQVSRSLKPPTTDEIIVGVERQFAPDLSGSLAYTYRSIRNLEFAPLIGTTRASYQYFGNATGTAGSGDRLRPGFRRALLRTDRRVPIPAPARCSRTGPTRSQTYSGVEVQLLKSFSHGWMARVSFAYNDWQQQIGPGAIVNPNNWIPGMNAERRVRGRPQRALAVQRQRNGRASPRDRGQCERLRPAGVPDALLRSGRNERPLLHRAFIQIGQPTQYRTPNVYEVDLQLSKTFALGTEVTVTPQFACFNLLDSRTVLAREGSVGIYDAELETPFEPSEGFDVAYEFLGPRAFRGGLRVNF